MKQRVLESIDYIYERAKGSRLEVNFFEVVSNQLEHLSEYFSISCNQFFILAIVISMNYKGDTVQLKDLIEYLDCSPMKILRYSDDFETLVKKGLLIKDIHYSRLYNESTIVWR